MELIFLIIIAVVDLVLGFLVISNNPNRRSNQLFALFLLFATLWAVGDALMLYGRTELAITTGVNLFSSGPLFVMLGLLYFANFFPDDLPIIRRKAWLLLAAVPTVAFAYA
ncbi:hypothetical protein KC973_00230, partial [Candidatus Saccharibacteria bacterium]|nr:hypothetical protein [Candidatus Saccharibacteria bacterium]